MLTVLLHRFIFGSKVINSQQSIVLLQCLSLSPLSQLCLNLSLRRENQDHRLSLHCLFAVFFCRKVPGATPWCGESLKSYQRQAGLMKLTRKCLRSWRRSRGQLQRKETNICGNSSVVQVSSYLSQLTFVNFLAVGVVNLTSKAASCWIKGWNMQIVRCGLSRNSKAKVPLNEQKGKTPNITGVGI